MAIGQLAALLALGGAAQNNRLNRLKNSIEGSLEVNPLTKTTSAPTILENLPWYRREGLEFSPDVMSPDRAVPEWAAGMFEDPEVFYRWYQSVADSPNLPAIQATIGSTTKAQRDTLAGRGRAVSGLEELIGLLTGELESFRADPEREALAEAIRARTDPNYRAISSAEEGAFRNRIAQAAARQAATRIGTAAGRGTVRSGTTLQDLAGLNAQAAAEGIQLQANVEGANREARAAAQRDLLAYLDRGTAIEQTMLGRLAAIESEIAAIEAGVDFAPTDFLAFSQLDFGQDQYLSEQASRNEALDAYIAAWEQSLGADENFDWRDALDVFVQLQGTGIADLF